MKYINLFLLISTAAISGCGKNDNQAPDNGGGMPVSAILATAVKKPVKETVEVPGSLSARDAIIIISELDATVTAVNITEGQQVNAGDKLFELDKVKTAALLAEAEAAHKLADLSHNRNKELLKSNSISQQKSDEGEADLKSKKARLDLARDDNAKTIINAPFQGMIGEKSVSTGQFARRGDALISLVKINPLDIIGDLPERFAASLKNGLSVEFKTDAYPDRLFDAEIIYIAPSVDRSSRTVRIKAEIKNADSLLKPGMFGRMTVILAERSDSLQIPEACIQMQGQSMMTVRVTKQGIAEFAPVTTGSRSSGSVEILSGLSEGDLVVVEGWQKMGPGSPVIAAPESQQYGVQPGPVAENDNVDL